MTWFCSSPFKRLDPTYDLSVSSSKMSPEPCGTGDVGISFVAQDSTDIYSLNFDQLHFCYVKRCLLYKEASLMRAKSCTDLLL